MGAIMPIKLQIRGLNSDGTDQWWERQSTSGQGVEEHPYRKLCNTEETDTYAVFFTALAASSRVLKNQSLEPAALVSSSES